MSAKKPGGLQRNPIAGRGIEGLIRTTAQPPEAITPNTQHTPITPITPNTQGQKKRVQKLPRINMSFSESNLDYLHVMAAAETTSITAYVNSLIEKDKEANSERYERIREAMRGKP